MTPPEGNDVTPGQAKTANATLAKRKAKAERLANELGPVLHLIDSTLLAAMAMAVMGEVDRRRGERAARIAAGDE